ncbi:LPS export ABC transporter periplasmic protein LptC [Fodinibius salsisoli]|uniref:LPS export ABC transporter periplasmic protein LptC n=1 Tax=Fodinibius salsisoli TaxID=2820877 RepID=A0ABT3PL24_9BACT|nr:LPS export ABC transporter periplasmic protein LptC [Fodinibius salsisoli]MCW9706650.1 LPS export ABC transporter periplasmic protein LptC [Fodinibius salsisoli]
MEPHKTLFSFFLSLLLLAGLSSCGELSQEQAVQVDEALSDSLTSTTESWDVEMDIIEEKFTKMHLTGSYAATYTTKDSNATRIKGPVNIQLYDTTGQITTWASSNRAVYNADEAIFELYGDVKVRTVTDRHLESEYLKWMQSNNNITTPKFVIIRTPSDSIAGTGFEGTTDLNDYTIHEPTGQFTVD